MQASLHDPELRAPREWLAADDSQARFEIYASGYFERLSDAIRDSFPRLSRALGEGDFSALMRDFLRSHPSRVRNLNDFGAELPAFLARREKGWMADLARLEWAGTLSFFADGSFSSASAVRPPLVEPPADRWPLTRVQLEPSVIPLELSWSVGELWEREYERAWSPRSGSFGVVVYRPVETVLCDALEAAPTRVLRLLYAGKPLGEAMSGWPDERASELQMYFKSWTERGWILGLDWS